MENHRRRIYRKLGVAGQGQAVFRGLGLLRPPPGEPPAECARGRELVIVHARCLVAAEVVTRALLGCGRALVAVRDTVPHEEETRGTGPRRSPTPTAPAWSLAPARRIHPGEREQVHHPEVAGARAVDGVEVEGGRPDAFPLVRFGTENGHRGPRGGRFGDPQTRPVTSAAPGTSLSGREVGPV
ncbi:hypothetical protein [Nonomuraea insulae]|uniref:HTH luxR-type domain-containing protein n=1 Tax=Nonomuraea insulae TaxID=1616787 RepID=A0ABW1CAL0_9ACTN